MLKNDTDRFWARTQKLAGLFLFTRQLSMGNRGIYLHQFTFTPFDYSSILCGKYQSCLDAGVCCEHRCRTWIHSARLALRHESPQLISCSYTEYTFSLEPASDTFETTTHQRCIMISVPNIKIMSNKLLVSQHVLQPPKNIRMLVCLASYPSNKRESNC